MRKPARAYPGDRVGDLSDEVPGELAALIDTANRAMDVVLVDPKIWEEEAVRPDAAALSWPPVMHPTDGLSDFLCWCAIEAVDNALNACARFNGWPDGAVDIPEDTAHPDFQMVLRVCNRAVAVAETAVRREFANAGRIDGRRALQGWLIKKHLNYLQRSEHLSVTEAAKRLGISPAAAYRWLNKG